MLSPTITAARPMTMVPIPMEISAPPWVCANSAPASATSALEMAMPSRIMPPVLTPWARAIRGLEPVARIARPFWVVKNQSSSSFAAITMNTSSSGRNT